MQSSKPTYSWVDIYGNLYLIMFDTFVSPTSLYIVMINQFS